MDTKEVILSKEAILKSTIEYWRGQVAQRDKIVFELAVLGYMTVTEDERQEMPKGMAALDHFIANDEYFTDELWEKIVNEADYRSGR